MVDPVPLDREAAVSSDIESALAELVDATDRDRWPYVLVGRAGFAHVAGNSPCVGYTILNDGRALCGNCGWQLSARLSDAGEERSMRFVLFALAAIGQCLRGAAHAAGVCVASGGEPNLFRPARDGEPGRDVIGCTGCDREFFEHELVDERIPDHLDQVEP